MDYSIFSITSLYIIIAYTFAGIIDSICGGGGLITVPTLMAVGIPTEFVIGTNQCAALPGALTAFYKFYKSGNIHIKSAICCMPFAALGAYFGAKLNLIIPVSYLQKILIVLVPILAVITLLNKNGENKALVNSLATKELFTRSALIGLIVGGYQGFYGPGSGMFAIMAFTMLLKLDLLTAAGNTRLVIVFSVFTASIAYALSGTILWQISIMSAIFYAMGSYLGACLAIQNGQKIIKPIVAGVSILLVVKIAFFS